MKMYSGVLDSGVTPKGGKMHTHYWFAESENNPSTDPVVVWFNGGPGASSMFGFLVELGPFYVSDASLTTLDYNKTGIPTLFRNEHSWTKVANLLAVDAPPPVGYSYCDDKGPSGDGYSCGDWTDTRTAAANKHFLESWVKAFPEHAKNELFITGESYAGVYVPSLAQVIYEDKNTNINLKGFAVGDACLGNKDFNYRGPFFNIEFMHGHGAFSEKLYWEIMGTCSTDQLLHGTSGNCRNAVRKIHDEAKGYWEYNLYDECTYSNIFSTPSTVTDENGEEFEWWDVRPKAIVARRNVRKQLGGALNDYPCGGGIAMGIYFNQTKVMNALNVPENSYFFDEDNGGGFNYHSNIDQLLPFYKEAINSKDHHLRIMVYNGDADPSLNSFRAANWTAGIGIREKESWRGWTTDGNQMMGGYVTSYENEFKYVTIRGAGHMVPEFKPVAGLELLKRFIKGDEFQRYNPH